jgi:hypothetical protein
MKRSNARVAGWVALAFATLLLAACGGGGGGGGASAPAAADARNGDYTMFAADAQEYTLSLDFDARTWRVAGNGVTDSGGFSVDTGGSGGTGGTLPDHYWVEDDAAFGTHRVGQAVLPFIAARSFVTTVADASGFYELLGRTVDTAGGTPNTTMQEAFISSDGRMFTCADDAVRVLANCPVSSTITGTLTVTGTQFRSDTPNGTILFRVARIGPDKVLLRAGTSAASKRQLWIGVLASTTFFAGNFTGGDTAGDSDMVSITTVPSSVAGTRTMPSGVATTFTGTVDPTPNLGGTIVMLTASDGGDYFALRGKDFGAMVSARDSTVAPGWLAIGHEQ